MFISPFLAAVLVGTFWTGVGVSAAVNHDGMFDRSARSDVVISATTSTDHRDACYARYRSYDGDTDMYMGFDGSWHLCRL